MGLLCMILSFPLADLLSVWNQELVSGGGGAIRDWIQKEASRAERINGVFFSDHSMQGLWMNILVLGGIAAFSEELFFRGLVQETLRKNGLGNWGSVIAAAFIFSAFHLEFNNFLPIFFLGIVLGYLYMLTKNLWVSILGHFFNNTFLLVSLYFDKASNTSTVDDHVSIGWTVGSSVLMILQFYVMRRYVMRFRTQSNK